MSYSHDHGHGHAHSHDHAHGHAHSHAIDVSGPRVRRALIAVIGLIACFFVVEVAGGIAFHSVALLSDAAHVLTDVSAYVLALGASWLAARPPTPDRTYGYGRAEVLAALVNASLLVGAAVWIVYHAVVRLVHPVHTHGGGVAAVAAVGITANLIGAWLLMRADRSNINARAALLHTLTDAVSSGAVLLSGLVVAATGWTRLDPAVAIGVAVVVVWASFGLLRESVNVLLDAAPHGVDTQAVAAAFLAHDGVLEVHDLHIWTMSASSTALSAHLRIAANADPEAVADELALLAQSRFDIGHATLQTFRDRSHALNPIDQLPPEAAMEWAAEHIARAHPELSRATVHAATGAAALEFGAADRVSPVALSVRALRIIGIHEPTDPHTQPG